MARLPRLVLAGHAHCVVQGGHNGQRVFEDDTDRKTYLQDLREAAAAVGVQIHAWALLDNEVLLLATPAEAPSLGRMMQALGRRYVSAFNRRHGRTGTLWNGRFRCAVVEPGPMRLAALRWIDSQSRDPLLTSAGHRLGGARVSWIVDPPEVWSLGNTPFDREVAYAALLHEGLPARIVDMLRKATLGGWAIGSAAFAADASLLSSRPALPRKPGRPKRETPLRPDFG